MSGRGWLDRDYEALQKRQAALQAAHDRIAELEKEVENLREQEAERIAELEREVKGLRAGRPACDDLRCAAAAIDNLASVEHDRYGVSHVVEVLAQRGLAGRLYAAAKAAESES